MTEKTKIQLRILKEFCLDNATGFIIGSVIGVLICVSLTLPAITTFLQNNGGITVVVAAVVSLGLGIKRMFFNAGLNNTDGNADNK